MAETTEPRGKESGRSHCRRRRRRLWLNVRVDDVVSEIRPQALPLR
jgi:hypothetical protein